MATRSGAALALVRDPDTKPRATGLPSIRHGRRRTAIPTYAELAEQIAAMQSRLDGLEEQQRQEAERQRGYLETIANQRKEIIRLIDVALESAKVAHVAKRESQPPDDGRPSWLENYGICPRTGEVLRWTEGGWVMAYWTKTPEQRERIRETLAKYPRLTRTDRNGR
jgi:hypothetical protein